jgi:hypothetical protein
MGPIDGLVGIGELSAALHAAILNFGWSLFRPHLTSSLLQKSCRVNDQGHQKLKGMDWCEQWCLLCTVTRFSLVFLPAFFEDSKTCEENNVTFRPKMVEVDGEIWLISAKMVEVDGEIWLISAKMVEVDGEIWLI